MSVYVLMGRSWKSPPIAAFGTPPEAILRGNAVAVYKTLEGAEKALRSTIANMQAKSLSPLEYLDTSRLKLARGSDPLHVYRYRAESQGYTQRDRQVTDPTWMWYWIEEVDGVDQ